jgi:hypothetical protein
LYEKYGSRKTLGCSPKSHDKTTSIAQRNESCCAVGVIAIESEQGFNGKGVGIASLAMAVAAVIFKGTVRGGYCFTRAGVGGRFFLTFRTLLAFVGCFDLIDVCLDLCFEDFTHEFASFDVQKVIEVVDVSTVGGVIADFVAVVE